MLCKRCREQIEVGEACVPQEVGNGHVNYFHMGCYCQEKTDRIRKDLERQAELARTVH